MNMSGAKRVRNTVEAIYRDESRRVPDRLTYARGVDLLLGTYNYLDPTPLGRQEIWEEPPGRGNSPSLSWVRHHDNYGDNERGSEFCSGSRNNRR